MPTYDWSGAGWSSLGRPSETPFTTNSPGVGLNPDGRLEIFLRGGDSRLYHSLQTEGGGGSSGASWSGWARLDGNILGAPTVARNADGRLEVFFAGTNNELFHVWQIRNGLQINWSGASGFGMAIQGMPAVQTNVDGRLELFVQGVDNQLWHNWQTSGGWGGWKLINFGGANIQATGTPAAGRNADGRLEVFVKGSDGKLWHAWQSAPNSVADRMTLYPIASNVLVDGNPTTKNGAGNLEVFWVAPGGGLSHIFQLAPNNNWNSSAVSLGGSVQNRPAIGRTADGRLEVFVRGTDSRVQYAKQLAHASGTWSSLSPLGGGGNNLTAPIAAEGLDGRLEVFAVSTGGELWRIKQSNNITYPGFVGVGNDGHFSLDGRRFRHLGVNVVAFAYHLNNDWSWKDAYYLKSVGVKQVRLFLPCNNMEVDVVGNRLATALGIAEASGFKLTVALTNFFLAPNYGLDVRPPEGMALPLFCVKGDDDNYTGSYVESGETVKLLGQEWMTQKYRDQYLPFVRAIVTRFKDHPGIFAWNVANELQFSPDSATDIIRFINGVTNEIKAIAPRQMVSPGIISTESLGLLSEEQKNQLYANPKIDYLTVHEYEDNNNKQQKEDRVLALRWRKPYVVEECGMSQQMPGGAGEALNRMKAYFESMYNDAGKPADAVMVWGVQFEQDHGSGSSKYGPLEQGRVNEYLALWKEWAQKLD